MYIYMAFVCMHCVYMHTYICMYIYIVTLYFLQVTMKFQVLQMYGNRTKKHEKLICIKLIKKFVCFRLVRHFSITVEKK